MTSDAEKSTAAELPSPAEMLNRFKTASRGYSLELESRLALKSLIRDTQPNTERDNYKLSVDRELWKPRSAISRTTPISACGGPAPHADVRSPRAESQLRMQRPCSACGVSSPRAETLLRMRRYLLGVRRLCSACGGSVLTCGDLFFKPSQPSRFITPPVLIVASILAWLTFLRSLFGTVTSTRL